MQQAYAGPQRHYHNARHILECLRLFDDVKKHAVDPIALELAIWFHDAVYEPRARDNEECSADLASDAILHAGGGEDLAARVQALVLTTKTHEPSTVIDAAWLLDIDLAILGERPELFDAYDAAIRAEYAWVDAGEFRARRADILDGFLARPQIYRTPHFRNRFETTARSNLQRAIARLRSGSTNHTTRLRNQIKAPE
jgi:predicted metal-dependent HD superfamily phosphohydrolase